MRSIRRDPSKAVHEYMPKDVARWNAALAKAAAKAGDAKNDTVLFEELILETYGAPMAPSKGGEAHPTLTTLRDNVLLKDVGVSLTPDFSVMAGACKAGVKGDDCTAVLRSPAVPQKAWGRYYTQIYNIYVSLWTHAAVCVCVCVCVCL